MVTAGDADCWRPQPPISHKQEKLPVRPEHRSRTSDWISFVKGPERSSGARFPPLPPGAIPPPEPRPRRRPGEPSPVLANWAHGLLICVCVLVLTPIAVLALITLALIFA